MGDHLIGGVENIGGGAVVLLQLDHCGVGIILLKVENIADVRTAPAVDALVVVADYADVAAAVRQNLHQRILGEIGVLVLVYMHIAESIAVAFQNRRMIGKQLQRPHKEIVEIKGVALLELALVSAVEIVDLLAAEIARRSGKPAVGIEQPVFSVADFALYLPQRKVFIVDIERFIQLFEYCGLIVVIIDGERTGVPQLFDVPSENASAHGMKCAYPDLLAGLADKGGYALAHFSGGLVGKGDRQNIPRRYAVIDQVGNTVGQRTGFAAARACQNQYGSFQGFSRFALLLIQALQIHRFTCFTSVVRLFRPAGG